MYVCRIQMHVLESVSLPSTARVEIAPTPDDGSDAWRTPQQVRDVAIPDDTGFYLHRRKRRLLRACSASTSNSQRL